MDDGESRGRTDESLPGFREEPLVETGAVGERLTQPEGVLTLSRSPLPVCNKAS